MHRNDLLGFVVFFWGSPVWFLEAKPRSRPERQSDSIVFVDYDLQRDSKPCRFLGKEAGFCMDILMCPKIQRLTRKPLLAANLKVVQLSLCGYSTNSPQVCCPTSSKIFDASGNIINPFELPQAIISAPPVKKPPPPSPPRQPPSVPLPIVPSVAEPLKPPRPQEPSFGEAEPMRESPLVPPVGFQTSCGIPRIISTRIVGGNESAPGAWPWVAALVYNIPDGSGEIYFGCGGALITNRHVVTAAHCTWEEMQLKAVRLGAHLAPIFDRKTPVQGRSWAEVGIEKTIVHPGYVKNKLSINDMAILKLLRNVDFTDNIIPVCLPWKNDLSSRKYVGATAYTAGWGNILSSGQQLSPALRHISLPVTASEVCKAAFKGIRTSIPFDDTILCAGDATGKRDSCQGDSGGPLMTDIDGTYYLIGVISSGYKCAQPGFYGIFMRVTSYLDWIFNSIK